MKEYICYRTKDLEGDIWCEKAFLFKNGEDVEKFFTKKKVASLFYDGKENEVKSIVFHKTKEGMSKIPYYIEINGGGWSGIEIVEMSKGYIINTL